MEALTYLIVAVVVVGLCIVAMSVGLIFRNKTFSSCGQAARDFDGEPIRCAACGEKVDGGNGSCKRKERNTAERAAST